MLALILLAVSPALPANLPPAAAARGPAERAPVLSAQGPAVILEETLDRGEPLFVPAPPFRGSLAEGVYQARARAVVAVSAPDGSGTGTFIRPEGFILTCAHVVGAATEVDVSLQDGTDLKARVLLADSTADLALLKVELSAPVAWAPIGDLDAIDLGSPVVAIGHPKGFGWTVNAGIVTNLFAFREGRRDPDVIQTQVPLNPGNSGGPLFDGRGELMGVVAQGDPTAQALNWCISARAVKRFLIAHAELLPKVTIDVAVAPAGAEVFLDGVSIGHAPRAMAVTAAGAHVVAVSREGMGTAFLPLITLQRVEAPLSIKLVPAGSLAVTSDAAGVAVYVDGLYRGETPLTLDVPRGTHSVTGVKAGTRTSHAQAVITAEAETEVNLAQPSFVAFLTVESAPAGALVSVDGHNVGHTPLAEMALDPGRHVVDISAEGERARRTIVELAGDAHRTLAFDLEPEALPTPQALVPPAFSASAPRPASSHRFAAGLAAGGLALSALSAAMLATQHDPLARGAAGVSMVAGAAGFLAAPVVWVRF